MDFQDIVDTHIAKEIEKQEESQAILKQVREQGLTSYYLPELYGVPDTRSFFPDEDQDDPMLSLIYKLYRREELVQYGMDEYLDEWDAINNRITSEDDANEEQEYLRRTIQESIESGWDYVHPDDDGWCVYLNETNHPEFWVKLSEEDGLDYMNRNPDGSYPLYTGRGSDSTQDDGYTETVEIIDIVDFESQLSADALEDLDLGAINSVLLHEDNGRSEYEVFSEKTGKILGIFTVNYPVTTSVDADSFEILGSEEPWWAFLVF